MSTLTRIITMVKRCTLLLTLAALSAWCVPALAQTSLRAYIDVAPLFNLSQVKTVDEITQNKLFFGYRAGAGLDINMGKLLYIGSGISFAMKGDQLTLPTQDRDTEIKIYSHYMQIPINIGMRLHLTPAIDCAIEAGPYFAYALGATISEDKILDGIKKTYNIYKDGIPGMNAAKLRRYDLGLGAKIKVALGSLYAMAGADVGLINELNLDEGNPSLSKFKQKVMKNTSFYLGAGFTF